jgi:hypothetical protein
VVGEISASYARAFRAADGPLSMGLSIKLIRGIGYFDLVRAAGDLVTTNDGVTGAGELVARTAQGGWGYGVDLGAWRALGPAWTASLAVQDLAGRVRWGRCVEEHTTTFHVRDATLEDLEDDPDDLVDEATETRGIGAFERRIGPVVVAGVAWKRGRYTGAADLRKSFEQGSGRVRRPLVAAGVEAYVASWLTARGGIGIGGWDDFATALGLTFSPGPVRVDVAMLAPGGLVPFTGRGVGAGIAIGLE